MQSTAMQSSQMQSTILHYTLMQPTVMQCNQMEPKVMHKKATPQAKLASSCVCVPITPLINTMHQISDAIHCNATHCYAYQSNATQSNARKGQTGICVYHCTNNVWIRHDICHMHHMQRMCKINSPRVNFYILKVLFVQFFYV